MLAAACLRGKTRRVHEQTKHHHDGDDAPAPDREWVEVAPATFWEERYAGSDRVWSGRANPTMVQVVTALTPGSALDLGCGEGGDVLWLASHGWQATGVDISQTAVDRGAAAAAQAGLGERARFVGADLSTWLPDRSYDLVTSCFLHSPVELPREVILRRIAEAVVPGGHLLAIAHAAAPPWSKRHHHRSFPTPEEDVAALALDPQQWSVELAEVRHRSGTSPNGEPAELDDSVVLLRRR